MDAATLAGWIAIVLSGLSLWVAIRADKATKEQAKELKKVRLQESCRVNSLTEQLTSTNASLLSILERITT